MLAFDLPSPGEIQFFKSLLLSVASRYPKDLIWIVHHGQTIEDFVREFPALSRRVRHVHFKTIRRMAFPEIDLFLTTEQYTLGLDGVYSVALFHGQPSKGLTFTPQIIESFDAFFLYGPLHRQAFDEYLQLGLGKGPDHLTLFEIGYPKSDDLLNGRFSCEKVLEELCLDSSRKTILYAPAFNEGASLP